MEARSYLRSASLAVAALTLSFIVPSFAQQPDNTGANKGSQGTATADQQKENAADRDLAKKIRQSLVEDKSLSTYGHNVKVIVRNGEVTLKGPVKSEDEKAAIETQATAIAGAGKVTNQLDVKSTSE